uniref:Spike glycoprotein n=1 Tax=Bat Coronavirus MrYN20 TaxID=3018862 RepID=A0AA49EFN6_9NIDO|nr:spike glycoprotein [Bat Coronavirus MrYN20]
MFFLLPVVASISRPNCYVNQTGQTVTYYTSEVHNITELTDLAVSVINRILPDPAIAYSGQVLRQRLYVANTTVVYKYPLTPPEEWRVSGVTGYKTVVVFNNSIIPVNDGFMVHINMYHLANTQDARNCRTPFGVIFGDSFIQDRVVLVTVIPGEQAWVPNQAPVSATVRILVCANVTICQNPGIDTWGPATTSIYSTNAFVDHASSCFYNETFLVPFGLNATRVSLAFRFVDGDMLMYTSRPQGLDFDPQAENALVFRRRVMVGANPPNAQFMQAFVGSYYKSGQTPTGVCVNVRRSLYYSYFVYTDVLVSYDDDGAIRNASICDQDSLSELHCVMGTFTPKMGVYPLSQYRAQVAGNVLVTQPGSDCAIPYGDILSPPQPIVWRRYSVSNCVFDFATIINNLPTKQLVCYGISPSKIASLCYASVTLDLMRINTTHFTNLISKVPDVFTTYNYKLPDNFVGCLHAYYLNYTGQYAVAYSRGYAERVTPGGRQGNYDYVNTVLGTSNNLCNPASCYGLAVITLPTAAGNNPVCPKVNNTLFVENKCVNFNVYGYSGTGVFTRTNLTIPNGKLFSASSSGAIIAVKISGTTFGINPCATAPVSIGYAPNYEQVLVFNGLECSAKATAIAEPAALYWSRVRVDDAYVDTSVGCVYNAFNNTATVVSTCDMPIGNSLCLISSVTRSRQLQLVSYDPLLTKDVPMTPLYWLSVPTNFTLAASTEYIQTTASKVNVDCVKYLCGDSTRCINVLMQYGTFCTDVNSALNNVATSLDDAMVSLIKDFGVTSIANSFDTGMFNFTSLLGCVGSNCGAKSHRSALTDLLYNKVKLADPGFMQSYQKCIDSQWGGQIRDLICTQTFNGISVLPPIVSPGMQALYTTALVGSIASAGYTFGVTSVGAIPFATQLQFRLNGLGVTTQVLVENQVAIANAFNKALVSIQAGFDATNIALAKMQAVVNNNAQQLQVLVNQLGNSFGAISASINEIFSKLDGLAADAEVDRLISGRMVVLNTYVTQLLIKASEIKAQSLLAKQKLSECVLSQSQRFDFCGNGTHIMSIPQLAPNGLLFIHYSYAPTEYIVLESTAGLCRDGVGYAPRGGVFLRDNGTQLWFFSPTTFFNPQNLTTINTQVLDYCGVNYTHVNYTVLEPLPLSSFDFDSEFNKYFKNYSKVFNLTFDPLEYNITKVNVSEQLSTLTSVVQQLNQSFIDLQKFNTFEQTIKWPWYVWLAMIAGIVGLVLAVVMLLCMTNCCSCFKGMCSCRHCHYDEIEDVYPAVRVHNKRTA